MFEDLNLRIFIRSVQEITYIIYNDLYPQMVFYLTIIYKRIYRVLNFLKFYKVYRMYSDDHSALWQMGRLICG